MEFIEEQIFRAATQLLLAVPNPLQWNGPAAAACARELELLAEDLRAIVGGLKSIVE
jgi:phosphopantothenate synthetase